MPNNLNLSQTSICNSALMKIGADVISSITEGTRQANLCQQMYTTLMEEVLGSAPWRFALIRIQLTPSAVVPAFDYRASFTLPNDCVRPLWTDADPWKEENGLILANNQTLNLIYIQRQIAGSSEGNWDMQFAEALAWRMAKDLALALVQSASLSQACAKEYMAKVNEARAYNAVRGTSPTLIADIWSGARRGYRAGNGSLASTPQEFYEP